ncbi:MAG TPA: NAD-dependent epimerase/dehydratase family protein [Acidimicrobiales bacterium]|jgi:CDP-paratose 2-epimerase|nr:NAD-dependent epimerase/dehydratase family protein [Acidimicrobiales bacterium]
MSAMERVLVTGGAGFVGVNVADRLLRDGKHVSILDDLSRPGVRTNLRWLREQYDATGRLQFQRGDVRDVETVRRAVRGVDTVFHFAAQVAVTTSVDDPRHDFAVNLAGTLNLLEEVRRMSTPARVLFTSTNKVYGGLEDVEIVRDGDRYAPADEGWRTHGIGESRPLDFCSPYGCSKGGADQYVLDYAKSYGLDTVVFRMSCIYGPHQQGNEDQGWVAHFAKQAMNGLPITLYGDGRQVRDVLFVEDLVDAMLIAMSRIDLTRGRAFNIGGGPSNTLSLLELIDMISDLCGERPHLEFGPWRVGDQRWYVSDPRAFAAATGWAPRVDVGTGVVRLFEWLQRHGHSLDLEAVAEVAS